MSERTAGLLLKAKCCEDDMSIFPEPWVVASLSLQRRGGGEATIRLCREHTEVGDMETSAGFIRVSSKMLLFPDISELKG